METSFRLVTAEQARKIGPMTASASHTAACSCGRLQVHLSGEPFLVSSCHCLECQRRTGAPFGANSFFKRAQATIDGESKSFRRQADSGNWLDFRFCPDCGSTVFWYPESAPETICIATGTLADPAFPAPVRTVWTECKHTWLTFPSGVRHHLREPA